jgi:hypothetical protein
VRAICHPEAQAHRTYPHTAPCGPKDLACVTPQLGRGSDTKTRGASSPALGGAKDCWGE